MAELYFMNNGTATRVDASDVDLNVPYTIGKTTGFISSGTHTIDSKNTIFTDMIKNRTFIGTVQEAASQVWYNIISVRHRNGESDGNQHGLMLYNNLTSNSPLKLRQHLTGIWSTERTLYDSSFPEIIVSSTQPSSSTAKIWIQP